MLLNWNNPFYMDQNLIWYTSTFQYTCWVPLFVSGSCIVLWVGSQALGCNHMDPIYRVTKAEVCLAECVRLNSCHCVPRFITVLLPQPCQRIGCARPIPTCCTCKFSPLVFTGVKACILSVPSSHLSHWLGILFLHSRLQIQWVPRVPCFAFLSSVGPVV